jgi:polyhydroxyalkanoate synthesis regulator phasin
VIDLIKKSVSTGLGLALLTKEKVENLAKELVKKGELSKNDGKAFVGDLVKRSQEAAKALEGQVEKTVAAAMKKMNVVTREDLSRLEKRVKELAKAVNERKP